MPKRTHDEKHQAHQARVASHRARLAKHPNPIDKAKELGAIFQEDLDVIIASVGSASKEEIVDELQYIRGTIADTVKEAAKALVGK